MNGPTGLRYEVLPLLFRMNGIKKRRHKALFDDLLVMESAALDAMYSD